MQQRGQQRHATSFIKVLGVISLLAACVVLPRLLPGWWTVWNYQPQVGDVLFQSLPNGQLVAAIEGATQSPWSHCGIVDQIDGQWVVHEALGQVRATPLTAFIRRGRAGRLAVRRPIHLTDEQLQLALDWIHKAHGRPYDSRFRLDQEALYCSELIHHAVVHATGLAWADLVTLGQLDWQPYSDVIQQLEGGPPPLKRQMITPRDLAASRALAAVADYGWW